MLRPVVPVLLETADTQRFCALQRNPSRQLPLASQL
jgi:hypothetical protein